MISAFPVHYLTHVRMSAAASAAIMQLISTQLVAALAVMSWAGSHREEVTQVRAGDKLTLS